MLPFDEAILIKDYHQYQERKFYTSIIEFRKSKLNFKLNMKKFAIKLPEKLGVIVDLTYYLLCSRF